MTTQPRIIRESFGQLPDGRRVERIVLRGEAGFEAHLITFGAAIQRLIVPDAQGQCDDVTLGCDDLVGLLGERRFFGATIGRYANRIGHARFSLDGEEVRLTPNNGPNALHGGAEGFDRKLWDIVELAERPVPQLTLAYASPDGEENYPGRLDVRLSYAVTGPAELSLRIEARTDRPTIVNLTNHSFFNLDGAASGRDILDHQLMIAAERFVAIDDAAIPLPETPREVAGTPFDFRTATVIGARIRDNDPQLRNGKGYDHTFCLGAVRELRPAARLVAPRSGRVLDLLTDQPGLQFYSGNYLDGRFAGKGGRLYRQSDALCLEPQLWPDSPNRPDFPTAWLSPGGVYRHHTVYRFGRAQAAP